MKNGGHRSPSAALAPTVRSAGADHTNGQEDR